MKKKNNYKVKYTEFDETKDTKKYLLNLSYLAKLNILLEKNLITKNEYEKVKCAIGIITPF